MQNWELSHELRLHAASLINELDSLLPDLDSFVFFATDKESYKFRIGKYPVTNAQFRRLMDARGYDVVMPWWTEKDVPILDSWINWRLGPRFMDNVEFSYSAQPVIGVSRYETVACVL